MDWKTLSIINHRIDNLNWLKSTGFIFGTFFFIPWITSFLFQIYNYLFSIQFEGETTMTTPSFFGLYVFGLIISSIGSSSFHFSAKHKQSSVFTIVKTKHDKETHSLPNELKTAEYIIYISLLVGLVKSISYELLTEQNMITDPMSLTIGIFTILFIGFIGFKVGQGENWARITLLVLFVVGIIFVPFIVFDEFQMSPLIGILSLLQTALQLYVLIILFTGESKKWYKKQRLSTDADMT